MKLAELFTADESERAVSPVIGVILMVAITVILAAVIGTFVLGLGDQVQETSPNAQWEWDNPDASNLDLTHESGDSVTATTLEVTGPGTLTNDCTDGSQWGGNSKVTAGQTCNVVNSGTVGSGTFRLIWTAEDSSQSSTLSSYEN